MRSRRAVGRNVASHDAFTRGMHACTAAFRASDQPVHFRRARAVHDAPAGDIFGSRNARRDCRSNAKHRRRVFRGLLACVRFSASSAEGERGTQSTLEADQARSGADAGFGRGRRRASPPSRVFRACLRAGASFRRASSRLTTVGNVRVRAGYSERSFENGLFVIIEGIRAGAAPDPCQWRTPSE